MESWGVEVRHGPTVGVGVTVGVAGGVVALGPAVGVGMSVAPVLGVGDSTGLGGNVRQGDGLPSKGPHPVWVAVAPINKKIVTMAPAPNPPRAKTLTGPPAVHPTMRAAALAVPRV